MAKIGQKMALIYIPNSPSCNSIPLFSVLDKLSLVFIPSQCLFDDSVSVFETVFEVSLVKAAVTPKVLSLPVEEAISVAPFVKIARCEFFSSFPVFDELGESTFIPGTVGLGKYPKT